MFKPNPVAAALLAAGAAGAAWLPFLRAAPNRMLSGEPVFLWDTLQGPSLALALVLLLCLLCCAVQPAHLGKAGKAVTALLCLQTGTACVLVVLLLALAGQHASHIALAQSAYARTSLGAGFWLLLLVFWLMAADALQRLQASLALRTAALLLVALPIALLLASGKCNELSILKEYANRADVFAAAMLRHGLLVVLALVPTLLLGVPLGWWAYKNRATGRVLFPLLNVIQTIPSIALFGLLMAPLALLASAYPALARAGISGVGIAPGVIALVLYSLLPVVRGTLAGLEQVPSSVVNAARGMGMSASQIFRHAEFPLALPVLLAGVRTATVAAVGLASVTALIGAGGLGSIMFEGLFSSAQDLVLLGVVPIVGLAVLVDAAFKLLIAITQGHQP